MILPCPAPLPFQSVAGFCQLAVHMFQIRSCLLLCDCLLRIGFETLLFCKLVPLRKETDHCRRIFCNFLSNFSFENSFEVRLSAEAGFANVNDYYLFT